nr:RagB/SusD family nutrient uptake outer membrane protein [uncultured Bacteroides sp.]
MNRKRFYNYLLGIALCLLSAACSDEEKPNSEQFPPTNFKVNGKVEKGPFVRGSSINMQPMDASMHETGKTFTSTIEDNSGAFNFGTQEFDTPYAKLTADGYFFNEVEGELSSGTLKLNAIVDLSDQQTINVNILTHLKSQRIIQLITKEGKNFKEANKQTQKELLKAFGLEQYAATDASQFSITSGTDEAGALIAVSALILCDRTEAEITEYLSRLTTEFSASGAFSTTTMNQIKEDRDLLNSELANITENIIRRYEELGKKVEVKDLAYYFDWNDDGIAGNEIAGEDTKVTLETSELNIPTKGGDYSIKISSPIPVSLTSPENSTDGPISSINPDYFFNSLYETTASSAMDYEKAITENVLELKIKPSNSRKDMDDIIYLYDFRGKIVASLHLIQKGDPNAAIPKLGENGSSAILGYALSLSKAITLSNAIDSHYTGLTNDPNFKAPVLDNNANLNQSWENFYKAINMNLRLLDADAQAQSVYQEFLNTYNALCYYNMVVCWGGVPYLTTQAEVNNYNIKRTPENEILDALILNLQQAINYLEEKRNAAIAQAPNDVLFISKDVARIILADIYMYRKEYVKAKPLLEQVVSNGYYQLESAYEYTENSRELILGLLQEDGTRSDETAITPVLTYANVLLSLAECEYHTGNVNKGKEHLEKVTHAKSITVSADLQQGIKETRAQLMLPGYFAFLKRNGLAISELNLKEYYLLLPIPLQELDKNSALSQNPGY